MSEARLFAFGLAAILCACSGSAASPAGTSVLPAALSVPGADVSIGHYIKHVVIVVQENRSFDNLFATFPGADGTTRGKMSNGKSINLKESDLYTAFDLPNNHRAFGVEYDGGKMDRWNLVLVYKGYTPCPRCAYRYVNPAQIRPYWTMAKEYVLADHMFPTESSGSFTAHQDLIRGNTSISPDESLIDFPSQAPWGCDAPPGTTTPLLTKTDQYIKTGPFPCLTYATLRDLLDAKHVSWKYYTPPLLDDGSAGLYWDAFEAIRVVRYGSEWATNVSSPEKNVLNDISKGALPDVSWVIPDGVNSDHAGIGRKPRDTGPSWVAQVVNAVGKSKYWDSTAIIVLWDDWGGWYDHVPPPQLDYVGRGIRVPMIVVSPYAKTGYVSHTQYEFGSVVKFVEDVFRLGSLGTTDRYATSIDDVFDFRQKPRKFTPIGAKYPRSFFEHQPSSTVPVDTN